MAALSPHLPIERAEVRSGDLDRVRELIKQRYTDIHPRVMGESRRFSFRSQQVRSGALVIDALSYQACLAMLVDPHDAMWICQLTGGRFDVSAGRQRSQVGRGESIFMPQRSLDLVLDRVTFEMVQFPAEAVTRVAARLGVPAAEFRFDTMTAVSPAANRQWAATHTYLTRLLGTPGDAGIPELLLAAAIDTAAIAALSVFPNTTMSVEHVAGPGRVLPATVRRAVAHIDSHAAEPVTSEDIAAAAGVSARALQAGFRRHLDTTPLGYLRRVRLQYARRDLLAADPTTGATVAAVARRWGFVDLSRFAADYREAFGQLPRHTLHT